MSHLFATKGSKLYIGGAKSFNGTDLTEADYAAISWTEIGGLTDLGQAGDSSELISSNHVAEARTRKLKGVRNAGNMTVLADLDYQDAGQIALMAAEKEDVTYAFRYVLNDAPEGGTASMRYFVALVMSTTEQFSQANSVMQLSASLEIDSNWLRVPAAA